MDPRVKSQLKNLLSEYEGVLKQIAELQKSQWRSHSPKSETSDETMYKLGKLDGKCEGVDEYLGELERLAFDHD